MKKVLLPAMLLLFLGCDKEFEPELRGWKAYTHPSRRLFLDMDGREKDIVLPGDDRVGYRFAQWTKLQDLILVAQVLKTEHCDDYQIVSIDTAGVIIDTIYTPPPSTALNFKLAPNDSLLLLKTYYDNCEWNDDFKYTFFNRFTRKSLPDTIRVENSRGILLHENIWSPDSKKVIIQEWLGRKTKAFTYSLVTKDTTYIDKGSNFIWSPTNNDEVAYIKDYSIYSKNVATGETALIFEGKKKRGAVEFRWSPAGDFLMIHVQSYLLNVDVNPLRSTTILYLSMPDKIESRKFYEDTHIATWKKGTASKDFVPIASDTLK
jgi:hypothetical protein